MKMDFRLDFRFIRDQIQLTVKKRKKSFSSNSYDLRKLKINEKRLTEKRLTLVMLLLTNE